MEQLPLNDTAMLVSAINFLLRDHEFDNLEQICEHFGVERDDLETRLAAEGFKYDPDNNRVW